MFGGSQRAESTNVLGKMPGVRKGADLGIRNLGGQAEFLGGSILGERRETPSAVKRWPWKLIKKTRGGGGDHSFVAGSGRGGYKEDVRVG